MRQSPLTHTPFCAAATAPVPDASRRRRTLRRLTATLAALTCVVGVTIAAPAVNASAVPVAAVLTQHAEAMAGPPAEPAAARPGSGSSALSWHTARAADQSSDVRQVCVTPKRGYAGCMSLLRPNTATVRVIAHAVTRQDFVLHAVSPTAS